MVNKTLLEIAVKLAQRLGANPSKFLGTKTNVDFLGSGPKDGMLFQQNINPEAYLKIGKEKVLPMIEDSMGYFSGGKLNNVQGQKLIDNMNVMLDLEKKMPQLPGTGGLGSLKETPEIASVLPGPEAGYKFSKPMSTRDKFKKAYRDGDLTGNRKGRQNAVDLSPNAPPGTIPAPKQKGNKYSKAFAAASSLDMQGKPLTQVYKNIAKIKKEEDASKQVLKSSLEQQSIISEYLETLAFYRQKFGAKKGPVQLNKDYKKFFPEKFKFLFPEKKAEGGRIGFSNAGIVPGTNNKLRYSKNLMQEYKANVDEGYEGSVDDYIREFYGEQYLDPSYAKGGRVGFSKGGLAKILEL